MLNSDGTLPFSPGLYKEHLAFGRKPITVVLSSWIKTSKHRKGQLDPPASDKKCVFVAKNEHFLKQCPGGLLDPPMCFSWFQVGFHGFSWFQVGFHGLLGSRLIFHGYRWIFMVIHSSRLVFHGYRLVFMVPGLIFMVFLQNLPPQTVSWPHNPV